MKVHIPHDLYPNRQADSHAMLRYLGVKHKLPKEGMGLHEICGVTVYVTAHKPHYRGNPYDTNLVEVKTSKHRIFAICNCGQHVPVGRLHQHKCKGE